MNDQNRVINAKKGTFYYSLEGYNVETTDRANEIVNWLRDISDDWTILVDVMHGNHRLLIFDEKLANLFALKWI